MFPPRLAAALAAGALLAAPAAAPASARAQRPAPIALAPTPSVADAAGQARGGRPCLDATLLPICGGRTVNAATVGALSALLMAGGGALAGAADRRCFGHPQVAALRAGVVGAAAGALWTATRPHVSEAELERRERSRRDRGRRDPGLRQTLLRLGAAAVVPGAALGAVNGATPYGRCGGAALGAARGGVLHGGALPAATVVVGGFVLLLGG